MLYKYNINEVFSYFCWNSPTLIETRMDTKAKYSYGQSDPVIIEKIGLFVQKTRLAQNRTQQEVADAAGINRTTLVQLEKGKGATLLTFISVMRALKQLQFFEHFEWHQELSPMKLAEMEMKLRRRARKSASQKDTRESSW